MKKLLIGYMIASLLFVTSFQVRADINPQNMSGTSLAAAGALSVYLGVAAGAAIAISGGLAIGALGVALLIKNSGQATPADRQDAPIVINLNPKVPLIVPSGWTAPSGSAVQPVPPSTSLFRNPQSSANDFPYPYYGALQTVDGVYPHGNTPTSTCSNALGKTVQGAQGAISAATYSGGICNITYVNNAGNTVNPVMNIGGAGCQAGYVVSGTDPNKTCSINSPTLVIKPQKGKMEIVRTGNTLAIDPQINPLDKLPSNVVSVSSTSATIAGSDGSITNVTINSDGTATITSSTPAATAGTSNQKIIKVSAPDATTGDVTVQGTSDQTVNGTGSAVGSTPLTTGGGTGSNIDISSLNKEATQQAIKSNTDTIKTDVTDIKNAITNADNNPTDLADKKTEYDTIAQAHNDAVKAIGDGGLDNHGFAWNWSISVPAGTCTPFSHSFGGHAITMDYCPGIYAARDFAAWLFYIFTGMTLTSIVTRRPD